MKRNKLLLSLSCVLLFACSKKVNSSEILSNDSSNLTTYTNNESSSEKIVSSDNTTSNYFSSLTKDEEKLFNSGGYVEDKIIDFSIYENTDAYRKVTNAKELIDALEEAKYDYTSTFNETTNQVEQTLNQAGSVHVIEIANDLDLGYKILENEGISSDLVTNFAAKAESLRPYLYMSDIVDVYGVSQIKIENTANLLVYSKNGAKITHAGFKLTSDTNVVFRNLSFDELWQWEDTPTLNSSKIGDYDYFGWAYFKISFSEYIWIDHCTFGKSYDGQIDYSNPIYNNQTTAFRAPYKATGGNGLHISYCAFNSGNADQDGYIYKMMKEIEDDYLNGDQTNLFYKTLRDKGITFEEILYGLALPQKKGFLLGDSGDGDTEYEYNKSLNVSFDSCYFKNFEDRIPKLRGGNAYVYNCVVDSLEYYEARSILISKGAKMSTSNFKCALVSQGVLCGNGGSIKLENSIYRGVDSFLKNNDSSSSDKVKGGYSITNCIYQKNASSDEIKGSSEDNLFSSSSGDLTASYFSWHTSDGNAPFTPSILHDVDSLESILKGSIYTPGCSAYIGDYLL